MLLLSLPKSYLLAWLTNSGQRVLIWLIWRLWVDIGRCQSVKCNCYLPEREREWESESVRQVLSRFILVTWVLAAGCTPNIVVLTRVFKFSTYNFYAGKYSTINNNIKLLQYPILLGILNFTSLTKLININIWWWNSVLCNVQTILILILFRLTNNFLQLISCGYSLPMMRLNMRLNKDAWWRARNMLFSMQPSSPTELFLTEGDKLCISCTPYSIIHAYLKTVSHMHRPLAQWATGNCESLIMKH